MKRCFSIVADCYDGCIFLLKLVVHLCCGVGKPRAGIRRVAIVTRHDLFPANHGGAVKIVQTARYLSFHYEEVLIITQSSEEYYVFRDGVVTQQVYPWFARRAFLARPADVERRIQSMGFPQEDRWMARPLVDRNFRFRVQYLAVRRPFHVMQAEFFPFVFAGNWASSIYPGLPVIAVEHNVEFARIGAMYNLHDSAVETIRNFEIEACRVCDRVVAVSEGDRDVLVRNGVEAARMAVIPLGVDLAVYDEKNVDALRAVRRGLGLFDDDFVVLFHGVLSYKPNRDAVRLIAFEIMPRLRAMGCPAKCLVVGMNPPGELAADDIILTGAVDELPPVIKTADVAVVPLLEGGGTRLKILEYFAAGVPVISTSKGAEGISAENRREILIDDSMDGISRLINELWLNDTRRRIIGENGRRFVQDFGWDRVAAEYCRLYDDIAQAKCNNS